MSITKHLENCPKSTKCKYSWHQSTATISTCKTTVVCRERYDTHKRNYNKL